MKKIEIGEEVALLMDINSPETPFFAHTGDIFTARDISIDPMMPSGYSVTIFTYGSHILVDKSAVVHVEDWKNIYNSVLKQVVVKGRLR